MKAHILLNQAIQSLRPNSEYVFDDADYSTIKWISLDGEAPSIEQIEIEIEKIKASDKELTKKRNADRKALLEKLQITEEEAKLLLS